MKTMRSIWAGAISFGLVVIPVKLYAATEQRDITFRQVHRKDGARIQFRQVRTPDFAFLDEDIEVRSQELKMAASLIDTMTEDFEPDQYRDAYREALEAVVQAKVEGNDIVRPSGLDLPEAKKQPADLTEILRASVAAAKGGGRGKDGDAKDEDAADTGETDESAKPKGR